MRSQQAQALLAQTELFGGLDEEALQSLEFASVTRRYRKGQLLFQEGDEANSLFVVAEGLVKLTRTSANGYPLLLAIRRPLDAFGELTLINGGPRPASAEALRATIALAIQGKSFMALLETQPVVMQRVLESLGGLLRFAVERGSDFIFLDLQARVAKLLLHLAETEGTKKDDEMVIDLQLTQGDLAAMAGGSRPAVNKILRYFEKRRFMAHEDGRIVIRNAAQLRGRFGA
jgi:CRP/FNR family transcriptional regulator, cyclic AMP receptor protein